MPSEIPKSLALRDEAAKEAMNSEKFTSEEPDPPDPDADVAFLFFFLAG
jgi:hypothetical protein